MVACRWKSWVENKVDEEITKLRLGSCSKTVKRGRRKKEDREGEINKRNHKCSNK